MVEQVTVGSQARKAVDSSLEGGLAGTAVANWQCTAESYIPYRTESNVAGGGDR